MSSVTSSLGSSLTSILDSFDTRCSALRTLLTFRNLPSDAAASLERAELELSALEAEFASSRNAILRESSLLAEAAALQRASSQTAAALAAIEASLPEPGGLPGDAVSHDLSKPAPPPDRAPLLQLGSEAAFVNGSSSSGGIPPPPAASPRPPPDAAQPTLSARSGSSRPARTPPQLALVTESELSTAPQYMRSRLDVVKVNAALQGIQKLLGTKYALCSLAPQAVRALVR